MTYLDFYLINHSIFPIYSIFFNIFFQLLFLRFFKFKYYFSTLVGFFLGLLILTIFEIIFFLKHEFAFSYLILNYLNYFLISFGYFCLLTTGKTSLRVRLLTEIDLNSSGISLKNLYIKYNSNEITKTRLYRMLDNNQIYKNKNYFFYKPSITLLIGFFLFFLKFIFFGKKKMENIKVNLLYG